MTDSIVKVQITYNVSQQAALDIVSAMHGPPPYGPSPKRPPPPPQQLWPYTMDGEVYTLELPFLSGAALSGPELQQLISQVASANLVSDAWQQAFLSYLQAEIPIDSGG